MNVPETVGVPLIVMVLVAQATVTPVGNPVAVPIPVAPVVVRVIAVKAVLIHKIGGGTRSPVTVLAGVTVIVPVAFTAPHPHVNGIL